MIIQTGTKDSKRSLSVDRYRDTCVLLSGGQDEFFTSPHFLESHLHRDWLGGGMYFLFVSIQYLILVFCCSFSACLLCLDYKLSIITSTIGTRNELLKGVFMTKYLTLFSKNCMFIPYKHIQVHISQIKKDSYHLQYSKY